MLHSSWVLTLNYTLWMVTHKIHFDDPMNQSPIVNTPDNIEALVPSGMGVPANATEFESEAVTTSTAFRLFKRMGFVKTDMYQDIKDVLARPYKASTGNLNEAVQQSLFTLAVGPTIAQTNLVSINRFSGMRFTYCVKIQVAATPFMAGIIRLYWFPLSGNSGQPPRNSTCTGCSQLPGVSMDISETTEITFKVPWVGQHDYTYVNNPYMSVGPVMPNLGIVECRNMTACVFPDTPAHYVVWAWLEDVELVGLVNPVVTAIPQGGVTIQDRESTGMISGYLTSKIGHLSSTITSLGTRCAWALRLGARLAASVGWSRPMSLRDVRWVRSSMHTYLTNVSAPDTFMGLGALPDAHVAPFPGFAGSDQDEMSFDYILTRPTYIFYGSLSSDDPVDTVKLSFSACPMSCCLQTTPALGPVIPGRPVSTPDTAYYSYEPAPVWYIGRMFQLYRGGFRIKVVFAKTKFHTGRLMMAFTPGVFSYNRNGSGQIPGRSIQVPNTSTMYEYTKICDLRGDNVCTFDIPFASNYPYLPVDVPFGVFSISVVDPLVNAATVANYVPFFVTVEALPDFEFAIPVTATIQPTLDATAPSAQVGIPADENFSMAEQCIGERVTSIKQLISRSSLIDAGLLSGYYAPWYFWTTPGTSTSTFFGTAYPGVTSVALSAGLQYRGNTFQNLALGLYGLVRGSSTFTVVPTIRGTMLCASTVLPLGTKEAWSANAFGNNSAFTIETDTVLNFNVPFYSATGSYWVNSVDVQAPTMPYNNIVYVKIQDSSNRAMVYVRAGEDSQLGLFLGAPRVVFSMLSTTDPNAVYPVTQKMYDAGMYVPSGYVPPTGSPIPPVYPSLPPSLVAVYDEVETVTSEDLNRLAPSNFLGIS
jgi:hypothetical protein